MFSLKPSHRRVPAVHLMFEGSLAHREVTAIFKNCFSNSTENMNITTAKKVYKTLLII